MATRAQEKVAWKHRNGKRGCCAACRRDVDMLRRNPDGISAFIDVIAEVLHGHNPRIPRVIEHRLGRPAPRKQSYLSCFMWGKL